MAYSQNLKKIGILRFYGFQGQDKRHNGTGFTMAQGNTQIYKPKIYFKFFQFFIKLLDMYVCIIEPPQRCKKD